MDGWTPKDYEERECYVPQSVLDYLAEYRETLTYNSDSDWIFQSYRRPGHRVNDIYKTLRKTFGAAGMYKPGHLTHTIRHAVATRLANELPLHVVQEIMGHSVLATTAGYLHPQDQEKRRAAGKALI